MLNKKIEEEMKSFLNDTKTSQKIQTLKDQISSLRASNDLKD